MSLPIRIKVIVGCLALALMSVLLYRTATRRKMVPAPLETKIVFMRYPLGKVGGQVHIMNLDGSGQRVLARGHLDAANSRNNIHLYQPVLSPDRRLIAFESRHNYNTDIYVMNVDGTQPTNITRSGGYNETTPAWATDNRRIVYQSADAGISHPAVRWMVAGFDGSQAKEIQEWEADRLLYGSRKVVKIPRTRDTLHLPTDNIIIQNADGSNHKRLTDNARKPKSENGIYGSARLSPDGKRIVFRCHTYKRHSRTNEELWIMNSDGSGQQRLVQAHNLRTPPAFTPDSKSVVYAAADGGNEEIYIVTPGQKPVQLTHNKLNDDSPDVR